MELEDSCGVPTLVGENGECFEGLDLGAGDEVHAWGLDLASSDTQGVTDEKVIQPVKGETWRKPKETLQAKVQIPHPGQFDSSDLIWDSKINNGRGRQKEIKSAIIPWDRLQDFVDGESSKRETPCNFLEVPSNEKKDGSIPRARGTSATKQIRYWCEFGPKDLSGVVKMEVEKLFANVLKQKKSTNQKKAEKRAQKVALKQDKKTKKQKGMTGCSVEVALQLPEPKEKEQRKTKLHAGLSMKRGCQCNFVAKQLYLDNNLCEIQFKCWTHTNMEGQLCHGGTFEGERHSLAGRLSRNTREWILQALRSGLSPSQIMSEHKREVLRLSQEGKKPTRDTFIMASDVYNLARGIAKELWEKHPSDAISIRMWTEQNPTIHFYYHEWTLPDLNDAPKEEAPFCLAIQSDWQLEMMVRFGHKRAISMDSTFGTNQPKYPLYTVMVFDEWENGIPVAFIIVGKSRESDVIPWLVKLNERCVAKRSDWEPNAIVVDNAQAELNAIGKVWPKAKILLCLWHVRKAWQENASQKIKADYIRALVLQGVADIMYTKDCHEGEAAIQVAKDKFTALKDKYPKAASFMTYFEQTWLSKIRMWVTGYRNIPHANQDTNAAIESYHNNLKSILRTSRQRFNGRRMDWLVYHLVGDVLTHYWYSVQCKLYGFIKNGKAEGIVASAVLRAREIPESYVMLYPDNEDVALVVSVSNFPHVWTVSAPNTDWAQCDCPVGQRGNICKHVVKAFKMINKDVEDGAIIRYAGTLRGTIAGGYDVSGIDGFHGARLIAEDAVQNDEVKVEDTTMTQIAITPEKQLKAIEVVLQELQQLALGNPLLRAHLLSNLNVAKGKVLDLKAKSEAGILHPTSQPIFVPGPGDNTIRRHHSFLEYKPNKGGNTKKH